MPDDLRPTNPRHELGPEGHPFLVFERGDTGETVALDPAWKPAFRAAGLVWVGCPDLPPRMVEADPGVLIAVDGLTDDPAVFRLMARFRRAADSGRFRPGPVDGGREGQ